MNKSEALTKMVAPNAQRTGIWRNGILQIHITRVCDKECFNCTQGSNLGGKPVIMPLLEFETALLSLKDYWGVIGIFGGNPCKHPQFDDICAIIRKHKVPKEQCGIWTNKLFGHASAIRQTFNPGVSNLNVHLDKEAWSEMYKEWPESRKYIKGIEGDSRHSSPYVAMLDQEVIPDKTYTMNVENTEENRWDLIAQCDINQNWSAMVCYVPGKGLRGFFCEIAGAFAMLHAENPNWPDTGSIGCKGGLFWCNQAEWGCIERSTIGVL